MICAAVVSPDRRVACATWPYLCHYVPPRNLLRHIHYLLDRKSFAVAEIEYLALATIS